MSAHESCPTCGRSWATQERTDEMVRLYTDELMTLEEIGQQFGLTRERVRQLIKGKAASARTVYTKRSEAKREASLAERTRNATPCRICGAPVLRGSTLITCSTKCSDAWKVLRYHLSAEENEKHRLRCARSYLKNPQKYKPRLIELAHRLVAGEDVPANRHWVAPNSKAAGYIREFGLDIPIAQERAS